MCKNWFNWNIKFELNITMTKDDEEEKKIDKQNVRN
jgi:hypothetical protein